MGLACVACLHFPTRNCVARFALPRIDALEKVRLSPDGCWIIMGELVFGLTGPRQYPARVYDTSTGKQLYNRDPSLPVVTFWSDDYWWSPLVPFRTQGQTLDLIHLTSGVRNDGGLAVGQFEGVLAPDLASTRWTTTALPREIFAPPTDSSWEVSVWETSREGNTNKAGRAFGTSVSFARLVNHSDQIVLCGKSQPIMPELFDDWVPDAPWLAWARKERTEASIQDYRTGRTLWRMAFPEESETQFRMSADRGIWQLLKMN